jgi:F-type H+-transporting ATPase subunit b
MQIDWITVVAQIVNFLVLVWLLHRFLYGPIVKAMESREQRIAARLGEAEKREREAAQLAEEYRARQAELGHERARVLAEAEVEAEAKRRKLDETVRREAESLRRDLAEEIADERESFVRDMRRRSAEHVMELARRVLTELSDAKLDEQMAAAFARQLQDLDPEMHEQLAKAGREGGGTITIRSRVTLEADAQRRITRAIHQSVIDDAQVHYETSDSVTSGIELSAGSRRLAWTLAGYLDELEQQLQRDLAEATSRAGGVSAA